MTGKHISNDTQYFSIVCYVFSSKLAHRGAGEAQSIAQLASDYVHISTSAVQVRKKYARKIKFNCSIDPAVGSCMYQWFEFHLPSAVVS